MQPLCSSCIFWLLRAILYWLNGFKWFKTSRVTLALYGRFIFPFILLRRVGRPEWFVWDSLDLSLLDCSKSSSSDFLAWRRRFREAASAGLGARVPCRAFHCCCSHVVFMIFLLGSWELQPGEVPTVTAHDVHGALWLRTHPDPSCPDPRHSLGGFSVPDVQPASEVRGA